MVGNHPRPLQARGWARLRYGGKTDVSDSVQKRNAPCAWGTSGQQRHLPLVAGYCADINCRSFMPDGYALMRQAIFAVNFSVSRRSPRFSPPISDRTRDLSMMARIEQRYPMPWVSISNVPGYLRILLDYLRGILYFSIFGSNGRNAYSLLIMPESGATRGKSCPQRRNGYASWIPNSSKIPSILAS